MLFDLIKLRVLMIFFRRGYYSDCGIGGCDCIEYECKNDNLFLGR